MINTNGIPTMKHKDTMLIVDDVQINREILKKIFDDFNILEAENGEDALSKIRRYKTDISVILLDMVMPVMNGLAVLKEIQRDDELNEIPIIMTTASDERQYELMSIGLGAVDYVTKPIEVSLVRLRVASALQRKENERLRVQNKYLIVQREEELRHQEELRFVAEHDNLTGLYNKATFCLQVRQLIDENFDKEYAIVVFDVEKFKIINDMFGFAEGDKLLCYIAQTIKKVTMAEEAYCRLDSDNFALCANNSKERLEEILTNIDSEMKDYHLTFDIRIVIGCYIVKDKELSVGAMIDRAIMAKRTIKGKYENSIAFYDEKLRQALLREQKIVGQMKSALKSGQFKMFLQGQFNYSTGELIGAEALVRWVHPDDGIISPIDFIPIFERNGFIQKLDEYMWEQACATIRHWLDSRKRLVPLYVSVNISRMDIYNEKLCDDIYNLVKKYKIPPQYLKLEITESAYVQNPKQLIDLIENLREKGFIVEIDDFGSGYSSLNTLKDLHVDVLKLDMKFLEDKSKIE
ncbi:MAG: EAL domain-containing protein, partial [Clostridia bacterium]